MNNLKSELKNTFTSYWQYMALRTACQLNIFDDIETGFDTVKKLVEKNNADTKALTTLISALIDAETIIEKNERLQLTEMGKLLTDNSPETLKYACIHWGEEHLTAWQNLAYTIKTGKPAFENIFDEPYFNFIGKEHQTLENYHLAMSEYARDDYKNITQYIDFSEFETIADVGAGTGSLIKRVAEEFSNKQCILADLPEVCNLTKTELANLKPVEIDFFQSLPFKADAIILSRVLHDWDDNKVVEILKNCSDSLNESGKLIIIEIMQDQINANLLSLNMLLMTESYERTQKQYDNILQSIDFKMHYSVKLNKLQTIIIAQKQ